MLASWLIGCLCGRLAGLQAWTTDWLALRVVGRPGWSAGRAVWLAGFLAVRSGRRGWPCWLLGSLAGFTGWPAGLASWFPWLTRFAGWTAGCLVTLPAEELSG